MTAVIATKTAWLAAIFTIGAVSQLHTIKKIVVIDTKISLAAKLIAHFITDQVGAINWVQEPFLAAHHYDLMLV